MATATDSAQPISNALYAPLRDRAADPAAEPDRPARARRRLRAAAVGGRAGPVRGDRRRSAGRRRPPRARRRRRRARSRAARRGPSRSTTATCAPESRRGWLYRGPDGAAARLRVRDRGRSGRAGRGPRRGPPGPGPRPPDDGRRSRAAPSRCGCRGVPTARSWPRCGPGSASTSSRSCCAGTGRSRTSAATCRSRPACSRAVRSRATEFTGPHRTGPSSGAPVPARHVCRCAGRVVASGSTWLPSPCPRTESSRHPPATAVAGRLARGAES